MPRPLVAAYYFPNFHADPRNTAYHGAGWTEWDLMRHARPRFEGHRQPRVPLWGYEDESDVRVMQRKIDAAADHGINCFLFDWYFYADGTFLERPLREGFLRASNRDRLTFALLWANHDWMDIFPARLGGPWPTRFVGKLDRPAFEEMARYAIAEFFPRANYLKLEGKPYFSYFRSRYLIEGLGSLEAAADALAWFRARAQDAGFPGLHINTMANAIRSPEVIAEMAAQFAALGVDSATHYGWQDQVPFPSFPTVDYAYLLEHAPDTWRQSAEGLPVAYYPVVSVGWDNTPRICQSDNYLSWYHGYPVTSTVVGETPALFGEGIRRACAFARSQSNNPHRIITINAWNEWTEGSYLEPDTHWGMGYLEALRQALT